MARFFKIKRRSWKRIISAVLVVVLVGSLGGALISTLSKDTKTIHPTFSLGGLDEVGQYVASDTSIYTTKAFECSGLRVQPDFESSVTYDIYLYDESEKFIEAKKGLTKVFADDVGSAKYARIVIHPEIPEDTKEDDFQIKWYQISGYASQIKITVDRVPEEPFDFDFNNKGYSADLYIVNNINYDSYPSGPEGSYSEYYDGFGNAYLSISLDTNYSSVDILVPKNTASGYCMITSSDYVLKRVDFSSTAASETVNGYDIYTLNLESLSGYLDLILPSGTECHVFGY